MNATQERQFKKQRKEGSDLSRAAWMESTTLTAREKRGLTRAWIRREARVNKQLQNHKAYLKRRAVEMEERVRRLDKDILRLRRGLLTGVEDLLLDEDKVENGSVVDEALADGLDEHEVEDPKISAAQHKRLLAQTMAVLDLLEEARLRDVLIRNHVTTALGAVSQSSDAGEQVSRTALHDASLVRLDNCLLLIAERVSVRMEKKYAPATILSWEREFRELGGYFKRDGRVVREREWILSEEDLSMELLSWLKSQKRVTTKSTHAFVNEQLLAREGGVLKLAKYGLSLPITTTINVWMNKLGCKHDRVKQSYYTDGHERPDVQAARKEYLRKQRKLALRKPCWVRVESSSLKREEQEAFEERRETGEEAFSAETFHFERGGKEYVEFHVDFLGAGCDKRHDALREELGADGGEYSIRFDKAAAAPCEHHHEPEVCRCYLPVYHVGQDESVYKCYARGGTEWVIRGVRGLRKKTEGPGGMVSAFQDEKRGFGLPLSEEEIARVNANRQRVKRAPLKATPGLHFLLPGKNREGYWGFDEFQKQVIDVMDCLEEVEPGRQLVIEVDHSAGHAKFLPDGLRVSNMNVKYGGRQKVVRDSVLKEGCLGPGKAKMYLNGDKWSTKYDTNLTTRVVDLTLKLGDVQSMAFGPNDPPPFYDLEAPTKDKTFVRRGKREQKEGYVGKPKGMKQVLWERGWYGDGMSTTSKDPEKNIPMVLGDLPDFKNERSALQHTVEKRGRILLMSSKFHPEVAGVGIEYSWGMPKLKFRRELDDEIPKHLHQNIVSSMCRETILTLRRVRRFARRTRDFCRAYLKLEMAGVAPDSKDCIEKMRKTCNAHRNIIDMEPSFIDRQ